MKAVLFLCVHNAVRSQMAAGLLRHLGREEFEVESAGFRPTVVHPLAVAAMAEIGIDISTAKSKDVFDLFRSGARFDYVITVCHESAGERCPLFPGIARRLQWDFRDPLREPEPRRMGRVVLVRDQLRTLIEQWIPSVSMR